MHPIIKRAWGISKQCHAENPNMENRTVVAQHWDDLRSLRLDADAQPDAVLQPVGC